MLTMLREQTFSDANNLPEAVGLRYLNVSYKKRLALIIQDLNQDYFSEIFTSASIPYQSEYEFPARVGGVPGASTVFSVSVNYVTPIAGTGTVSISALSSAVVGVGTTFTQMKGYTIDASGWRGVIVDVTDDTHCTIDALPAATITSAAFTTYKDNWQKALPTRISNFYNEESWYRANQPESSPKFVVYDDSIFIYPYCKSAASQAVRFYGSKEYDDLVISPSPTTPVFDTDFHYSIVVGAKKFVAEYRGLGQERISEFKRDDIESVAELENMMRERNLGYMEKDLSPSITKSYE
jgi:hypothetical protein